MEKERQIKNRPEKISDLVLRTEKETAGNRCDADGVSIKTKNGETILDFYDGILTLGKVPRHS